MKKIILFITIFLSLLSVSGFSADKDPASDDPIPQILDPEYRHNKSGQFEISPYGGSYLGVTLGQTWIAGARGYYHLNSTYAFGINYGYSQAMPEKAGNFGQYMRDKNVHVFDVESTISNDVAIRIGKLQVETDFYLTLGAGTMNINDEWMPTGLIGGGVKFYTGVPWLAVRLDVNNYAHYTNLPGNDHFDFDVSFIGGVSLLFPHKKPIRD